MLPRNGGPPRSIPKPGEVMWFGKPLRSISESYRELNDPTSDTAEARSKRQVQTATYFASAGRDTFFNCDEEPRFINHSMHSEHTISK
jgi:hypothetical protein